jgi:hypothetical protein
MGCCLDGILNWQQVYFRVRYQTILENVPLVLPLIYCLLYHLNSSDRQSTDCLLSIMKHLNDLMDINHQMVYVNFDPNRLTLNVESIAILASSYQLLMLIRIHLDVVEVFFLSARMLLEKYQLWVWVSYFAKELSEDMAILQAHPVGALLVNTVIRLKTSVLFIQFFHLLYIVSCVGISLIGVILPSNLDREANISHIVKFRIVGVSSHHGRSS